MIENFKRITNEVLENVFYSPEDGEFFVTYGTVKKREDGYKYDHPTEGQFQLSRVFWMLETGEDPGSSLIDHADTDPFNNKFSNLRKATREQNGQNKSLQINNTSGVKGVYWDRSRRRWRARIASHGKILWSAYYKEEDLDLAARDISEKRRELHGEFARDS